MKLKDAQELKDKARRIIYKQMIVQQYVTAEKWNCPPAIGIHIDKSNNYRLAIRINNDKYNSAIEKVKQVLTEDIDVRVTGQIYAQQLWQERTRPLCLGLSIGHPEVTAGTLGCFVREVNKYETLILSNNHVLANENAAQIDDPIIQPGKQDGGSVIKDKVASLKKFIPISKTEINTLDAAVAEIQGVKISSNEIPGMVRLKGIYKGELGGLEVMKIGRTTGITYGKITAIEVDELMVQYSNGKYRFDGQIEIEGLGQTFSEGGDSGSLIMTKDGYAIGLLFAGTSNDFPGCLNFTYATPIETVLEKFNLELIM